MATLNLPKKAPGCGYTKQGESPKEMTWIIVESSWMDRKLFPTQKIMSLKEIENSQLCH